MEFLTQKIYSLIYTHVSDAPLKYKNIKNIVIVNGQCIELINRLYLCTFHIPAI